MNKNKIISLICITTFFSTNVLAEEIPQQNLTIYQVMQRVLDKYPSLKIATLAVEQAAHQKQLIESQLGWILNSSSGVTHDLTALGTPSDRLDITASFGRKLSSGASLSLSGGYRYEDSSLALSSVLPNPAHTTRLDLNYRLPLLQGEGNPAYQEGITASETSYRVAKASHSLTRLQLAEKVKDVFYTSALTLARLKNASQSVRRAQQLKKAVNKDIKLGLLEKKDRLQVEAQLNSVLSELSTIKIVQKQQNSSLNRLMLEDWNSTSNLVLTEPGSNSGYSVSRLIKQTVAYHPSLKILQEKLTLAESKIYSAKDNKKDNLDLVMSVGSRTSNGKSTTGTVSEQDWAGSIKLEYKHLFDNKGLSAKHNQALIDKNIAEYNIQTLEDDIRYRVAGLVAEIEAAQETVKSAKLKLHSESLKLKEAEQRFRNGRTNTAQLIQFHNEYSFAKLSLQKQVIDLNNRIVSLQIFSGEFWYKFPNNTDAIGNTPQASVMGVVK